MIESTFKLSVPLQPAAVTVTGECVGSQYVLTATPVNTSYIAANATYSWYDVTASTPLVGNSQTIVVTETHEYSVTVIAAGCSGTDNLNVDSINCIIQKGISVDGDGNNDFFDLTGYNVKKLTIFNRFGMKVYTKNDYSNLWVGQSDKGDELPDGTYFYIIDLNNNQSSISDWIYINRKQ